MSEHARLSPSAAHRWIPCSGSLALEESLPKGERTDSVHSREGTAAHELAQWTLNDPTKACADFVGRFTSNDWEVTHEMAKDVQVYIDNIRDYAKGNALFVEKRVDFSEAIGVPNCFGTLDAGIITTDGEELQIHDLKFGRGVQVFAEENEQLMIYALGMLIEYGLLHDFKRVRLVIHQPRLHHLSEWDCTVDELITFSHVVRAAAREAISGNGQLVPGKKQCQWCKAAAVCPALTKTVTETIGTELDTPERTVIPKNATELALKMDAIEMIEIWCKAIRAEVERTLFAGDNVPGYKLVQGRQGHRAWVSDKEVEDTFKAMRLTLEEMYNFKLISPTDAEKLLKDQPRRWKKIEPLITRAPGKPSVASMDDKRPALIISAVTDELDSVA